MKTLKKEIDQETFNSNVSVNKDPMLRIFGGSIYKKPE